MSNLEKVIGWEGGAAEPRVITIWDEERQTELIEAINSIIQGGGIRTSNFVGKRK